MNRKTTGIAAILLCFAVGVVVGINGHSLWLKYKSHNSDKPIPYVLGNGNGDLMLRRLSRELHLTFEQNQKLREIGKNGREKFKEFFDENRPKMEELVQKFESDIQNILTDEQKVLYTEFQKRQRELMRMPQPNHRPPSPGKARISKKEKATIINGFFREYDKDKDDLISTTEAPSFIEGRFKFIDKNNDNFLSRDEITYSVERRMFLGKQNHEQWRPHPPHHPFDQNSGHKPRKNCNLPPRPDELDK